MEKHSVAGQKKGTRALQREATRSVILAAATEEFSHRGYDGASMNTIARQADISKPNLLYYFKNKESLWEAVADHVFDEATQALRQTIRSLSPDQQPSLAEMIEAYFTVCQRHPAYVLIPMVEGINPSWRTDFIGKRHLRLHAQAFRDYLSRRSQTPVDEKAALHLQNLIAGGAQLYLGLSPLWRSAIGIDTSEASFIREFTELVTSAFVQQHPELGLLFDS